jgi:hypothetical protein
LHRCPQRSEKEIIVTETIITESTSTAIIHAPIEYVDIADWVFTLPDAEYQRCSPAHIAAGFTTSDDGRRMSLNVETIGGSLMVQHYVEDIAEQHHVRLLSTSDVIGPGGRTKSGVVWELSVRPLDGERCELSNHVIGKTTPEYWESLGKSGVPFEVARQAQNVASTAHNAQETPLFAESMEKKALRRRAAK